MDRIAANEIGRCNGLGAGGENLQNWMPLINAGINAGTTIATTAITAKNQSAQASGSTVTGGSTSTYAPTTTGGTSYRTPAKQETNWTPWIIGGVVLLGGLALIMNSNGGRRK